jgi:hypothetical protein
LDDMFQEGGHFAHPQLAGVAFAVEKDVVARLLDEQGRPWFGGTSIAGHLMQLVEQSWRVPVKRRRVRRGRAEDSRECHRILRGRKGAVTTKLKHSYGGADETKKQKTPAGIDREAETFSNRGTF